MKGIKHIDILIITHPHNDHIGGAPYLMRNYSIGEIWETNVASKSKVFRQVHDMADSLKIPIKKQYAGNLHYLDNQIYLEMLHPSKKFIKQARPNFNNASLTFKLTYKDINLLFTGDIEKEGENYLSLYRNFLDSEILKVPHHGSSTSSTTPLIKYTSPDFALISVGARNKFGHPSLGTIDRYKSADCKIHRTDKLGSLYIKTNGKEWDIIDWRPKFLVLSK